MVSVNQFMALPVVGEQHVVFDGEFDRTCLRGHGRLGSECEPERERIRPPANTQDKQGRCVLRLLVQMLHGGGAEGQGSLLLHGRGCFRVHGRKVFAGCCPE